MMGAMIKSLMVAVAVTLMASGCFYEPARVIHPEPVRYVSVPRPPLRVQRLYQRSTGSWVYTCDYRRQGHYQWCRWYYSGY